MADFVPPSGPPPPRVPEGWKAQWNAQYSEWFYVNVHTKQSQWDKPTAPAYPEGGGAPAGPPPGHAPGARTYPAGATAGDSGGYPNDKLGANNPYSHGPPGGSNQHIDEDARYAAKLQAEEDARARTAGGPTADRGESDSYYGGGAAGMGAHQGQAPPYGQQPQSYDQQQLPPRDGQKKGGLSGLLGKFSGKQSSSQPQQGYGGGYGGQPQYAQQGGYGGYPQQGGYPPQQGYGGYPPQGGYGGGYQQAPPKKSGMGGMGGAALGLGGGLVGGALLANAFEGGDGGDGGGDGGGDYGGGDDYGGGGDDGGGGGGD